MTVDLKKAYRHCAQVARREAKNFYYAFVSLPPKKRRAIYATYAFSRLCDDIADQDAPVERKIRELNNLRKDLEACYSGQPRGPVFEALMDSSTAFEIPQEYFEGIVQGVEMDLTKVRYQNFEELRSYCYKVASVVGLVCIEVFGYRRPEAREYAVDLGIAMQLTNILRDVKEDAGRGRIYIPLEELKRFGYTEEQLLQSTVNSSFLNLMTFQAQRAREYFDRGLQLIPLLPVRSRACPTILAGVYKRLLDEIEREGFRVFNERISLSTKERMLVVAKLWIQSFIPRPSPARES